MAEPYAYRETLESVLDFTGGRRTITCGEALEYLGMKHYRALHKRCPHFRNGAALVVTFAKDLCRFYEG